jgi:hypothetical protein
LKRRQLLKGGLGLIASPALAIPPPAPVGSPRPWEEDDGSQDLYRWFRKKAIEKFNDELDWDREAIRDDLLDADEEFDARQRLKYQHEIRQHLWNQFAPEKDENEWDFLERCFGFKALEVFMEDTSDSVSQVVYEYLKGKV